MQDAAAFARLLLWRPCHTCGARAWRTRMEDVPEPTPTQASSAAVMLFMSAGVSMVELRRASTRSRSRLHGAGSREAAQQRNNTSAHVCVKDERRARHALSTKGAASALVSAAAVVAGESAPPAKSRASTASRGSSSSGAAARQRARCGGRPILLVTVLLP